MRYVRDLLNLNQGEFAEVLGVGKSTYQNYERDDRLPDADALCRLPKLGWNVNWLLTGEGQERLEPLSGAGLRVSEAAASYGSQPLSLDRETLIRAEKILGLALGLARVQVGGTDRAQMLADVYDHLIAHGFDGDQLLEITQALKEQLNRIQESRDARKGSGSSGSVGAEAPERHR